MKTVVVAIAAVFAVPVALADAASFGAGLENGEIWNMEKSAFFAQHGGVESFRPLVKSGDSAMCLKRGFAGVAGNDAYEATVWFEPGRGATGKVSRVELSLFNAGDAGSAMNQAELEKMIASVRAKFSGRDAKWDRPVRLQKLDTYVTTQNFRSKACTGELAWGTSKPQRGNPSAPVNFVRFTAVPPSQARANPDRATAKTRSLREIGAQTVRRANGDVVIEGLPMVDQGEKGYCAVASAERVMRHYGVNVDEHELAQLAGSTSSGGTDLNSMSEAVARIASAWRLGKNDVYVFPAARSGRVKIASECAKAARRGGMRDAESKIESSIKDIASLARTFGVEALMAARAKQGADAKKFLAAIKDCTLKGIPLFWGVELGIFPEPGVPQEGGGHMRLITGFNQKTGEILYSDSWGLGHEEKRMRMDRAWTITHSLFFLRPLR